MDMSWLIGIISPTYKLGVTIWNQVLSLCLIVGIKGPAEYSEAWQYTTDTLNPFFVAIAATMLNMFFYIGFCRQVGNFKENMTLETGLNIFMKMIIGNVGINFALNFAKWMFSISKVSAGMLMSISDISFGFYDLSAGEMVFYSFFGIIFLIVSICASATIFITMYTRIIHLYLLAATGPLAVSCIPGGPGIQNAASSWIKELIAKACSIIAIVLGVALISKIATGSNFFNIQFEEMAVLVKYVRNMFIMMLIAAYVKGADSFVKRTFGL
ncbi:hypothetical protein [Agathobacter sp.]|uniref:hypothetical protein n=1 Tax=Agathobacter sp. TaxID=2021311 RepID=UPI002A91BF69|nr:hypothetical protein [Agathobacter sp.]MDY5863577.1 hypothetical protein [Agathobacter sp.]